MYMYTPLFKKNLNVNNKTEINLERNNPYFDNECKSSTQNHCTCLNYCRNNPCDKTRVDMVQARSAYKNIVRKKRNFI